MPTSIRILAITLPLLVSLAPSGIGYAHELSRGAILSASCEGCHGTNGHSVGAIPPIAGRPVTYLVETLESFRSGKRQATVMGRHVKGYTEEEVRLIAEYFAKQK